MSREIPPYPESHDLLAGKGVVVTAAAGTGIGFATAKRCAEEGARVVISDHHERRLGEAADTIAAAVGERPHTIVCDVTDDDAVRALVDGSAEALGGIDVMVNNAGLGGEVDLVDMTDDQWDLVLDVTLNGTFRTTRAALRYMLPRGSGVIVNNASVLGWRAQRGQAHYAAAKAGVMALTRCAAIEAADAGVRVNAVAPSLATHPFLTKVMSDDLLAELEAKEAFGRGATPVGGGQRHRLPGQRLLQLHDRRSRGRQLATRVAGSRIEVPARRSPTRAQKVGQSTMSSFGHFMACSSAVRASWALASARRSSSTLASARACHACGDSARLARSVPTSAKVKPTSVRSRMTPTRATASGRYRRWPETRVAGGSRPSSS